MCEQRRRYLQKDTLHGRYGFQAYLSIQNRCFGNVKKTEEDFRKSEFYIACIKWGRFILDVNCMNPTQYLLWLQKLNVPIDTWTNEVVYAAWLQDVVYSENPWDGVDRSVQTILDWAEETKEEPGNYFNKAGGAKVLFDVQRAKISAWCIYCSVSGQKWISNLPKSDLEIIWSMINPERWEIKFKKYPAIKEQISEICNEVGL
jgi:hypothetical protein